MQRVALADIKQRRGPKAYADWPAIATELLDAYHQQQGIVVEVPDDVEGENFRHAAQIMLKQLTEHPVGVSIRERRQLRIVSFNVWLKDKAV